MAWLNAIPEGKKKSRRESFEAANADSFHLKLPDIDDAGYIVSMLFEAGTLTQGGMAAAPLTWQEIEAWLRLTSTRTELWERLLVKQLSSEYVSELHAASAIDRPEPFIFMAEVDDVVEQRKHVNDKLLDQFRGFQASRRRQP
jgi:hypothetical protein